MTAIGVVIAGAAAVFAWVQAHSAVESLKDAREARDEAQASAVESARLAAEANDAFKRQAVAQEEANRLKLEEMTPPDWSGPEPLRGELQRLTNTSKRVLVVSKIDVQPESMAGLVKITTQQAGGRYEYGDVIEFIPIRTMAGSAQKLTIVYSYEGDDEQHKVIVNL
ncbi:hypothetical protein [Microbacterium sp. A93]|uniref:hypothetical protein n=1 Tax=Microbacterium sp. A93 TaxID=3450716 RepID=UPI003F4416CA